MENGVKKTIFQTLFLPVEEVRENWGWCLSVEECDMAIREKINHSYHSLFFLSNFHYNCRSLTVHFYMFINLYMYLSSISIYLSIYSAIYLSIHISIHLSIYLSIFCKFSAMRKSALLHQHHINIHHTARLVPTTRWERDRKLVSKFWPDH